MAGSTVVAGIDVGGRSKGFHAVIIGEDRSIDQFKSVHADKIADWCRRKGARVVAVDAPCRWSRIKPPRPAEQELMDEKIWCFSTPTRSAAQNHPKNFYGWMLNGERLYHALANSHPLYAGSKRLIRSSVCFETFPHAVTCALFGGKVSAENKRADRRELLSKEGIDTSTLTNIDWIDAAVCALTADFLASGQVKTYGEPKSGFIVVSKRSI